MYPRDRSLPPPPELQEGPAQGGSPPPQNLRNQLSPLAPLPALRSPPGLAELPSEALIAYYDSGSARRKKKRRARPGRAPFLLLAF
ncbi:hypothetical protein CALCODRAFT_491025 [Calocera cornea HHB12733]|uniref:Uncharacterized protein n=1 Tax=Calocera cornea HHB12733 TaxID=1353952 RepID=A0A165J8H8_9BASI|nr:hypothetical protein CALCODRAFT_491025 [Calocera cornea HHB12733]